MNFTSNISWANTLGSVLQGNPVTIKCADGQERDTIEIVGDTIVCDMNCPVVTWTKRKVSFKYMTAEAAWILSGSNLVADIVPYNERLLKYSDDGLTFFGAYGPKVIGQINYIIETLAQDPSSRRAVLNIWRENPPVGKDTPCTLSAQFLIRNNTLDTVVTMRSSDVWLGLPYDIFTFSMIAGFVFLKLRSAGLKLSGLGSITNFAGSRHLYQQDVDKIKELKFIEEPGSTEELTRSALFHVQNFDSGEALIEHLWAVARGSRAELKDKFLSDLPHIK